MCFYVINRNNWIWNAIKKITKTWLFIHCLKYLEAKRNFMNCNVHTELKVYLWRHLSSLNFESCWQCTQSSSISRTMCISKTNVVNTNSSNFNVQGLPLAPFVFFELGTLQESFSSVIDYIPNVNAGAGRPWVVIWLGTGKDFWRATPTYLSNFYNFWRSWNKRSCHGNIRRPKFPQIDRKYRLR